MNILKRLVIILAICLICLTIVSNSVNAYDSGSIKSDYDQGIMSDASDSKQQTTKIIGTVLSAVRVTCVGIGLIILTVLGGKYMFASPDGRADIKNSAIGYFVGALIMFGASGIVTIAIAFANSNIAS